MRSSRTGLTLSRVVLGALLVVALVVGGTAFRVWQVARQDDRRPVDFVMVLGAAQYHGKPSDVLEARLDQALELYRDLDDERPGGVGIYFISHVGGHKYAANVIIYRRRDFEWYRKENPGQDTLWQTTVEADEGAAQGIWLARVRPEDCENIVKYTVLQGKVVKPGLQLRGGFDRERGKISW